MSDFIEWSAWVRKKCRSLDEAPATPKRANQRAKGKVCMEETGSNAGIALRERAGQLAAQVAGQIGHHAQAFGHRR